MVILQPSCLDLYCNIQTTQSVREEISVTLNLKQKG